MDNNNGYINPEENNNNLNPQPIDNTEANEAQPADNNTQPVYNAPAADANPTPNTVPIQTSPENNDVQTPQNNDFNAPASHDFGVPTYTDFNNSPNNFNPQMNNQYYNPYQNDQEEKKGFSIASLVLGICGFVFSCCGCLSVILQILAVIFGSISLSKKQGNRNMAIAGIVLGIVGFILYIAFTVYLIVSGKSQELVEQYYQYLN